jgi:hypothetical protein
MEEIMALVYHQAADYDDQDLPVTGQLMHGAAH